MSAQAEQWFENKIRDKVSISYQANGGYLDNTMMNGDTMAGTVRFPIAGRIEAYKLTGAIQLIQNANPDLSTVEVKPEDYEAPAWWTTQDVYKSGPSEQMTLARLVSKAIRRENDRIKWRALNAFYALGDIDTIGDGTATIDLTHTEAAAAQIFATGAGEDDGDMIFCPLPHMWMSQLCFYEEFKSADYRGPADIPFSSSMRRSAKTVRRIHYFAMPDELFDTTGAHIDTYMWARSSMGAETHWSGNAPTMSQHPEYEGSPWLVKKHDRRRGRRHSQEGRQKAALQQDHHGRASGHSHAHGGVRRAGGLRAAAFRRRTKHVVQHPASVSHGRRALRRRGQKAEPLSLRDGGSGGRRHRRGIFQRRARHAAGRRRDPHLLQHGPGRAAARRTGGR